MVTCCEFDGCSTLTVGRFCLSHDERPVAIFPRGRPYPAQPRRVVEAGPSAALVANGEPLFYLWVRACEGFRVEGASGRVGVVDGVVRGSLNEVRGVRVRQGLFRPSLTTVLLDQIQSIAPVRRSLVVSDEETPRPAVERAATLAAV
jgi:hypothetical protein